MASTFSTIAIVALILGVLFLIAAAVIFVKLKIWIVMADLSGKTAQISIEQLRNQDGKSTKRTQHRSYVVNSAVLKRNKGTEQLKSSSTAPIGKRLSKKTDILSSDNETVPLKRTQQTKKPPEKTAILNENGTDVLKGSEDTAILDAGTAVSSENNNAQDGTEILYDGTKALNEGTTLLQSDATTLIDEAEKASNGFRIITDIVMINTDEIISLGNN